jgi:hypothetical protein
VRYHELQRFQMDLKLLAERYTANGLEARELRDAAAETLTRMSEGAPLFDDAETEAKRAADYELDYYEAHRPPEVIT